jgi:LysM repeat protein
MRSNMARRRNKKSPWTTLPIWGLCLTLIGWGLWQAELLRRSVVSQGQTVALTPGMAVGPTQTAEDSSLGKALLLPATTRPEDGQGVDTPSGGTAASPEVTATLEPTPSFDAALSAEDLVQQGMSLLNGGKAAAGRYALNEALARTTNEARAAQLRQVLATMNAPVFLGTDLLPDDPSARMIPIRSGDTFLSLARSYGVPVALLQKLNPALDPRNLQLRTGVKIVQGPFHVRIAKHAGRLDLYARDIYVASCLVSFPEGNYLPRGDYEVAPGTKLQVGGPFSGRTWIGFRGVEPATEGVTSGWMFGAAGPRGSAPQDRTTGMQMGVGDLAQLYNVLSEGRSHVRVEP